MYGNYFGPDGLIWEDQSIRQDFVLLVTSSSCREIQFTVMGSVSTVPIGALERLAEDQRIVDN